MLNTKKINNLIFFSILDREFINVEFNDKSLTHGHRYIICIHADNVTYDYEKWTEFLDEMNACSDGVVVDLTPPKEGKVWIGNNRGIKYQVLCLIAFIKIKPTSERSNYRIRLTFCFDILWDVA